MRHLLNATIGPTPQELTKIFAYASAWQAMLRVSGPRHGVRPATGLRLATLFWQPSTRTRLSFEAAAHEIGATVLTATQMYDTSSMDKGETEADTARVVGDYAHALLVRHPRDAAVRDMAQSAGVPVISGGGDADHPTQALLDLFTIQREVGRLDKLTVAIAGDLKHARTVRALLAALARYGGDCRITFVGPHLPPEEYWHSFRHACRANDLHEAAAAGPDVVYLTRCHTECHGGDVSQSFPLAFRPGGAFHCDEAVVKRLPATARILHPLPRGPELPRSIDTDPRAAYFRQAENGLALRCAILCWCWNLLGAV